MDLTKVLQQLIGSTLRVQNVAAEGLAVDAPAAGDAAINLGVAELRLSGVQAGGPLPGRRSTGDPTAAGRAVAQARAPASGWALAPVEGLTGDLDIDVADAAWVLDADVRLPIESGRIDFNRATVSHFGPDSSLGLSRLGLYVDAPNGRQYLAMLAGSALEGMRFERRGALLGSGVTDRGLLALAPLLQAVIGGARTFRPAAGAWALLERIRLGGQLHLADGPLGRPERGLVLTGAAAGRNQLTLSGGAGGRLVLQWSALAASRLRWSGRGGAWGKAWTASAESIEGHLELALTRAVGGTLNWALQAAELRLRECRLAFSG
jgi:hypothetical protein